MRNSRLQTDLEGSILSPTTTELEHNSFDRCQQDIRLFQEALYNHINRVLHKRSKGEVTYLEEMSAPGGCGKPAHATVTRQERAEVERKASDRSPPPVALAARIAGEPQRNCQNRRSPLFDLLPIYDCHLYLNSSPCRSWQVLQDFESHSQEGKLTCSFSSGLFFAQLPNCTIV